MRANTRALQVVRRILIALTEELSVVLFINRAFNILSEYLNQQDTNTLGEQGDDEAEGAGRRVAV